MILIASGAYVGNDLVNELGKLPPSFLPLQNSRLYRHQLDLLSNKDDRVVLSIPNDYVLEKNDREYLNGRGVEIVRVPVDIALGSSIVYVLDYLARYEEPLRILFGDTLFRSIGFENDICYVSSVQDNYNWDFVDKGNSDLIFSGYFSFSDQKQLIKSISEKNFRFIEAVRLYRETKQLTYKAVHDWLDFGLTSTYFQSKALFTTQRVFNDLEVNKFSVRKSSENKRKMTAESAWFQTIPVSIKYYTPNLYSVFEGEGKFGYEVEYLYSNTLSDLFVFGNQPSFVWKEMFSSCRDFLQNCFREKRPDGVISNYTLQEKTIKRLEEFSATSGFDLDQTLSYNGLDLPSLNEIIATVDAEFAAEKGLYQTVVHGDFCFSNILYDFRRKSIKVIDPRGLDFDDNVTIYGDIRYDLAKLSHSAIGCYDLIVSGCFDLEVKENYSFTFQLNMAEHIKIIQSEFLNLKFFDKTIQEHNIYSPLVHLFLSMLPLHSDDRHRQSALLANALRMYVEFLKFKK